MAEGYYCACVTVFIIFYTPPCLWLFGALASCSSPKRCVVLTVLVQSAMFDRVFVVALLLMLPCISLQQTRQCLSSSNVGTKGCIRFTSYTTYSQTAICRSDSSVRSVSNGLHSCSSGASYCWYQCVLDEYGRTSGTVPTDCRCYGYSRARRMSGAPAYSILLLGVLTFFLK